MSPTIRRVFTVAAATILIAGGSVMAVRFVYAQRTGRIAFTAVKQEKFYRYPTGEYVQTTQSTLTVKADGSQVDSRFVVTPNGEYREMKAVVDTVARKRVAVDNMTNSITTTQIGDYYLQTFTNKPRECEDPKYTEKARLIGYEVVRVVKDLPGPVDEVSRSDSWQAPKLDCFPLKETIFMGKKGQPVMATNQREVVTAALGEPAPSLFEIPGEYTERAPSAVFREYYRKYPDKSPCPTCMEATGSILDEAYSAQQPGRIR